MSHDNPIVVLGAGAWGTALANSVAREGRPVWLVARDPAHANAMAGERENARRLPGVKLAESVSPTADLACAAKAGAIILAAPTQATRSAVAALAPLARPGAPVIVTAKGIEQASGHYPRAIAAAALPAAPVAILSGPSFAADVARGLPTAVVLAADDEKLARALAEMLSGPGLRCYHGDDPRGVEIGGAAKNVLAIAAGIVAGGGLGESARAALVARGFAELARFAKASGGRPETLMGLSGLGDLVLTCGSARSRNFAFGQALGRGDDLATAAGRALVEGAFTAEILIAEASRLGVEMPICSAVADVVKGRATIRAATASLLARPLKTES